MLAIQDAAISHGAPEIGTDFLVASFSLINDQAFQVWFTRGVSGGTTKTNYLLTGPSVSDVAMAQYLIEERDGVPLNLQKGIAVYLTAPLQVGQWTLSISNLVSNDVDSLPLPTNTQIVFDLVDKSTNDSIGTNLVESPVSKFIPAKFRSKPIFSAIIAGIEAGDTIVRGQAEAAFNQYHICTASEKYLEARAKDVGVSKSPKLGISDQDFRNLTITVTNNKLCGEALLAILENLYGTDSVSGYVESGLSEPFELFDKAYLDLLVDGKQSYRFLVDWRDYATPQRAMAIEIVASMNLAFENNQIAVVAKETLGKIRIYSKTRGLRSSISVVGGTLQPYLQLDSPVFDLIDEDETASNTWRVSNPRTGIARFTAMTPDSIITSTATLRIGDYVTVLGTQFPLALRGSYRIIDVYSAYETGVLVEWFEIESDYVVPVSLP